MPLASSTSSRLNSATVKDLLLLYTRAKKLLIY